MRADKAKVVDEVWDEERVRSFLDKPPMGDENIDFSRLLYAYRSMRVEDFSRFLVLFKQDGGDSLATSKDGRTLLDVIKNHAKSGPFVEALAE